MTRTLLKASLLSLLAFSLVISPALGQRGRGRSYPIPAYAPHEGRMAERSLQDIHKATEAAFHLERLAAQVNHEPAAELTAEGYRALESARRSQADGNFFQARELAKAAKALFEAAQTLYEGELGYKVGRYGQPEPPSRSYFDAPFRARERLSRVQAELNFKGDRANPLARQLIEQAQELATASPTEVNFNTEFQILAEHRAAYEMAKAASHLLAAERGF